jgi:hypothetical protein
MLLADFSDRSMWLAEFSVTHMFWSCVTRGFFLTVQQHSDPADFAWEEFSS